jgi:hypothetical protein
MNYVKGLAADFFLDRMECVFVEARIDGNFLVLTEEGGEGVFQSRAEETDGGGAFFNINSHYSNCADVNFAWVGKVDGHWVLLM